MTRRDIRRSILVFVALACGGIMQTGCSTLTGIARDLAAAAQGIAEAVQPIE